MKETLKMMKSILNGKENLQSDIERITEYKDNLSPNILAYYYVNNFGLIFRTAQFYPELTDNDKASFILQELDNCLQTYDETLQIDFKNYFIKFLKYRLNNEQKKLFTNNKKALNNYLELDVLSDVGDFDSIENYDLIFQNYGIVNKDRYYCKLRLAGYTMKEISRIFRVTPSMITYTNNKIKKKILKFI